MCSRAEFAAEKVQFLGEDISIYWIWEVSHGFFNISSCPRPKNRSWTIGTSHFHHRKSELKSRFSRCWQPVCRPSEGTISRGLKREGISWIRTVDEGNTGGVSFYGGGCKSDAGACAGGWSVARSSEIVKYRVKVLMLLQPNHSADISVTGRGQDLLWQTEMTDLSPTCSFFPLMLVFLFFLDKINWSSNWLICLLLKLFWIKSVFRQTSPVS